MVCSFGGIFLIAYAGLVAGDAEVARSAYLIGVFCAVLFAFGASSVNVLTRAMQKLYYAVMLSFY